MQAANDPRDLDRGWSVEIAWPWKSLAELSYSRPAEVAAVVLRFEDRLRPDAGEVVHRLRQAGFAGRIYPVNARRDVAGVFVPNQSNTPTGGLIAMTVSRSAFVPPPKVMSAVVHVTPAAQPEDRQDGVADVASSRNQGTGIGLPPG